MKTAWSGPRNLETLYSHMIPQEISQMADTPGASFCLHKTVKFGAVAQPSQKKPFTWGLDYVASSRPTELNNLYLLSPLTEVQHEITQDYERLHSNALTKFEF